MNLSELFIRRPVMTVLLNLAIGIQPVKAERWALALRLHRSLLSPHQGHLASVPPKR